MVDDSRVEVLENRVNELENILRLRGQSQPLRETCFEVVRWSIKDSPVPAGIVGRRRGDGTGANFTTILYVNEAFHEYYGYKNEEVVNQPYTSLIPENPYKTIEALSGVPVNRTIRVRKKNGDIVNSNLIKDDLRVSVFGREIAVLARFYLYPIEEE